MTTPNEFTIPESFIRRYSSSESNRSKYRSAFMRDRDRIMYCTAFRRLAGKTQIYTIGPDDHKKNRLTHSLEVAQIARTISRALGLDEDLTEAIALGHDLGHTPFGHAGEEVLNSIMAPNSEFIVGSPFYNTNRDVLKDTLEREETTLQGIISCENMFGFKHNIQSVRVAAVLEDSYRGEQGENIGINLTNYALWGMMHHSSLFYHNEKEPRPNYQNQFKKHLSINNSDAEAWSFEAFVVEWADDFAQWHHDLEDAIRSKALPMTTICKTIKDSLSGAFSGDDEELLDNLIKNAAADRKSIAELSHIVVNTLVKDLVENSLLKLDEIRVRLGELLPEATAEERAKLLYSDYNSLQMSFPPKQVISVSSSIEPSVFKNMIKSSVHHSKDVERMNSKGGYIIKKLFEAYYSHPQQLPDGPILHFMVDINSASNRHFDKYNSIESAKAIGMGEVRTDFDEVIKNPKTLFSCLLMRRICDHVASMTDRYAIEEYNNLYG